MHFRVGAGLEGGAWTLGVLVLTQSKESTTQCRQLGDIVLTTQSHYIHYTKTLYSLDKVIGDTSALQATMV